LHKCAKEHKETKAQIHHCANAQTNEQLKESATAQKSSLNHHCANAQTNEQRKKSQVRKS